MLSIQNRKGNQYVSDRDIFIKVDDKNKKRASETHQMKRTSEKNQ